MHNLLNAAFLLTIASSVVAYDNVKMTCLVNKERTDRGLKPLSIDDRLVKAAQAHSDDQAKMRRMTHDGSDGSDPGDRCTSAGYDWETYGENVGYGFTTEASVMEAWMNSPGHKANILRTLFYDFGSAAAVTKSVPYYTQNFGSLGKPGKNIPKCDTDNNSKTIRKKTVNTYVPKATYKSAAANDTPKPDYNYDGGKYGNDGTGEFGKKKPPNPPAPAPGPNPPAPAPGPNPPAPAPGPNPPAPAPGPNPPAPAPGPEPPIDNNPDSNPDGGKRRGRGRRGRGRNPDNGGQNPDNGGQNPDDGGQSPDDGGQNPDNGGQNPDDGGQNPDNGGQNPDDGGQNPDNGGQNPDGGKRRGRGRRGRGQNPDNGGQNPDNGGQGPENGRGRGRRKSTYSNPGQRNGGQRRGGGGRGNRGGGGRGHGNRGGGGGGRGNRGGGGGGGGNRGGGGYGKH